MDYCTWRKNVFKCQVYIIWNTRIKQDDIKKIYKYKNHYYTVSEAQPYTKPLHSCRDVIRQNVTLTTYANGDYVRMFVFQVFQIHFCWWKIRTGCFLVSCNPLRSPLCCATDSNCAAFDQTLDGALTQSNEHDWGKPTVNVLTVAKVFRVYTYSVVYQSGCDNLIFNSENDGCYIIIVAQRSCWLLCCGSCALPSVLLIKFLPKCYQRFWIGFQCEAERSLTNKQVVQWIRRSDCDSDGKCWVISDPCFGMRVDGGVLLFLLLQYQHHFVSRTISLRI